MARRLVSISVLSMIVLVSAAAAAQRRPAAQPQPAQPAQPGGGAADPMAMGATEAEMSDLQARERFRIGRGYYDQGRFPEAAAEFRAAYELSNRAQLLFNVYVAYREAGDLGQAVWALESFLERVPGAPDRVNLEARLTALRQSLADQRQAEQDTARARADAERARQEQERLRQREQQRQRADEASGPSVWSWVVMGTGGALLAAGGITGVLALGKTSDLEAMCEGDFCLPGFESVRDEARTMITTTDVLLGLGIVTVGAGVAIALLTSGSADDSAAERGPTASAGCGPTGCAVALGGTF